jgi:hypothetical protein
MKSAADKKAPRAFAGRASRARSWGVRLALWSELNCRDEQRSRGGDHQQIQEQPKRVMQRILILEERAFCNRGAHNPNSHQSCYGLTVSF